jgi:hypothetical protein
MVRGAKEHNEVTKEHFDMLQIDKHKDSAVLKTLESKYSVISERFFSIPPLLYEIIPEKTELICSTISATRYFLTDQLMEQSSIIGYIYSSIDDSKAVTHQYISFSSTYTSKDGEYRRRFMPYENFLNNYSKYTKEVSVVEADVVSQMNENRIVFNTDTYVTLNTNLDPVKKAINDSRIVIKIYISCWLSDYFKVKQGIFPNHQNPAFKAVITSEESPKLYEKILQLTSFQEYWQLSRKIGHWKPELNLEVGQKLFPLTYDEVRNWENPSYTTWREIYFTTLCSNLVVNLICPAFPIISNWFYIPNMRETIFDNNAMHMKYEHSKVAEEAISLMEQTDNLLTDENDEPYTERFAYLSKQINESIVYGEGYILLSNIALCMISEYTGHTFRDEYRLRNKFHIELNESQLLIKYTFDILYALYCMNTKLGLLHGDLHLNNITVKQMGNITDQEFRNGEIFVKSKKDDMHVGYIIGDNTYAFKTLGYTAVIIDFSRSIIGNHKLVEDRFGEALTKELFVQQRPRMIRLMYRMFPKFMDKHRDRLEALLIEDFELAHKIISVIDCYFIAQNMESMIIADKINSKEARDVVIQIQILSRELITKNLELAFKHTIKDKNQIEWPIKSIIETVFKPYVINGKFSGTLCDVFNSNLPVKYDITNYDKHPPIITTDENLLNAEYKKYLNYDPETDEEAVAALLPVSRRQRINKMKSSWMFK